jgi:glycosyltransferase involved in cell wall biosynthesis
VEGANDRRNVCILSPRFYPLDLRVKRRAEALLEDGFGVHVICLRDEGEAKHEVVGEVSVHRLPLDRPRPDYGGRSIRSFLIDYNVFFVLAAFKLMALDVKHGFQAVQVGTPPDYLVFAALVPKLAGAKTVLDMRDPVPELLGALIGRRYLRPFVAAAKFAEKLSLRFADRALAGTREMRDNCGMRGADVNKITVIVDVADDRLFHPGRYEHLAEKIDRVKKEERRAGKFRVVCHGPIAAHVGAELIVRAAARIRDDIPGIEFRCIGTGPFLAQARALARGMKVEDNVTCLGDIPVEDVIEEILTADVAVVPVEANPYSALIHPPALYQYIALQKPVVAARLGSVAAYFPDDSVVFFEPGNDDDLSDKLRYVFAHPEEMAGRVERCSEIYETYRWGREKRKYVGLYNSLLTQ